MRYSGTYHSAVTVWQDTHDYDAVLQHMRDKGVSKVDSIVALREVCCVSLGDAKRLTARSRVWEDTSVATEQLHDAICDAITREDEVEP
mgnify:CR=1 FL=1